MLCVLIEALPTIADPWLSLFERAVAQGFGVAGLLYLLYRQDKDWKQRWSDRDKENEKKIADVIALYNLRMAEIEVKREEIVAIYNAQMRSQQDVIREQQVKIQQKDEYVLKVAQQTTEVLMNAADVMEAFNRSTESETARLNVMRENQVLMMGLLKDISKNTKRSS